MDRNWTWASALVWGLLVTPSALAMDQGLSDRPETEVNLTRKSLSIPDLFLDPWLNDADNWDLDFDRPAIRGVGYNLQVVFRRYPIAWTVYLEMFSNRTEEGYFDDVDDTDDSFDNGEWLKPVDLGAYVLGANAARDIELAYLPEGLPWLTLRMGGGIGLAILTGRIDRWYKDEELQCLPTTPAFTRKDTCDPDTTVPLPPVAPVIDLGVSLRIQPMEPNPVAPILSLDAGMHDMLYLGASIGAVF
ncbi:MAG: hypothetical protein QGG40_02360 [Myxococcota bacterium]|jgi:hypothetical protein|nr:hypothetical protein [Myxococcota bacterium]